MKKIVIGLIITSLMSFAAAAQEIWTEGTHYKVIADKATEKKEVLEFFSYWCPHCFNFEPLVKNMKAKFADDVEFKKVHVNFMGFTSREIQDDATRAMMVARALKKEEAMNQAIFKYIHVARSSVTSLKDLKNIFVVNGIEPAEFDKMASSFGVNSMVQLNNKTIQKHRKNLSSVPNFIVNGKYQATFTRDMDQDDMIALIVWLSNKK